MFKPYQFVLHHIWQTGKQWAMIQIILLLILSVMPIFSFWVIKGLIDRLSTPNQGDFVFFRRELLLLTLLLIIQHVFQKASSFLRAFQSNRIQDHFAALIQVQSMVLDMTYYDNADFHNTLHRAQEEAHQRPALLLEHTLSVLQHGLAVLAVGAVLFYQHPISAVVLVATAIPVVFVKIKYAKKLYKTKTENTLLHRQATYLHSILTQSSFAKEVRLFQIGLPLQKRFLTLRKQLFTLFLHIYKHQTIASIAVHSLESLGFVSILAVMLHEAYTGHASIGALVMSYQVFQRGQVSLRAFLKSMAQLYHNQLFIKYIYDFLQLEPIQKRMTPFALMPPQIEAIHLRNVSFWYPNSTQPVLKNINTCFQRGQIVALVGENGSGKTTLAKLLCRLYDVADSKTGQGIFVGSDNIKQFDLKLWQSRLNVLFQDFKTYHFTVRDNIALKDFDENTNLEQVQNAARQAAAASFIEKLPQKYNNLLDKELGNGATLSGGQRQKIALARAFYETADLIILDEPTSSIDPLTEFDIFNCLKDVNQNKILILITHKLYNLKMVDHILVLSAGQMVESGCHETLMAAKGHYYNMFNKQQVS
ncbi:MAG: hypothetical protein RIS64_2578 [Bacteroidota bacterium]|jgi:ATP-binding cassette subfamily B protein